MTQAPDVDGKLKVFCIFAHPDDEAFGSGGTLAALVRQGHNLTTVCATNGDVGEISDPALATPENLWQVRQEELRNAMAVTGIPDVRFLGYRDSGMAGTDDNQNPSSLSQADPATVESQIAAMIEELSPDLVFTHDPTGGYGHPDHVTVSARTTAVVEAMGPDRPHLYYVCFPRQNFRKLWQEMTDAGITPPFAAEALDSIGSPDDYVTTVKDVSAFVDVKRESLQCHQTQLNPKGPFGQLTPGFMNNWLATEYFYLQQPNGSGPHADILADMVF
ncbi:MAG: PIG-L family deacetylase [Chloroflexi bacterium]|nr:PIG-L family deacetylase [Chloroflexota bacterium]MDA1271239.1 PIG-L family deacetylase [Chloroflexota bacterium]